MLLWREWVIRVFRPRHQPMTTLLRGQSRAAELMSPVDLVQDSAEKTIKKGLHFCKPLISLVPGARLELARGCPRRILSPLRLPIPPSRQTGQLRANSVACAWREWLCSPRQGNSSSPIVGCRFAVPIRSICRNDIFFSNFAVIAIPPLPDSKKSPSIVDILPPTPGIFYW